MDASAASTYLPHSVYLPDGRLLCWYHRAGDDEVQLFQLTIDQNQGVGEIPLEQGLVLLDELGVGRDGRPLRI